MPRRAAAESRCAVSRLCRPPMEICRDRIRRRYRVTADLFRQRRSDHSAVPAPARRMPRSAFAQQSRHAVAEIGRLATRQYRRLSDSILTTSRGVAPVSVPCQLPCFLQPRLTTGNSGVIDAMVYLVRSSSPYLLTCRPLGFHRRSRIVAEVGLRARSYRRRRLSVAGAPERRGCRLPVTTCPCTTPKSTG